MNLTGNFTSSRTNNTTAQEQQDAACIADMMSYKASTIAKIFSLSVIMFVSLVGNVLVIYVVYMNRSLRRTINFFIVNIAVSDLMIPILVIPRVIVELARDDVSWLVDGLFGEILCKVVFFLSDISATVSIISLIFMTVDRFLAVVFPLRITLMNSKRRYCLIALTWIISAAFFSPYFYAMKLLPSVDGKHYCMISWNPAFDHIKTHKAYSTAISILFLVIPFFTLSILYTIILIKTTKTPALIRNKTSEKARQKQKQTARRVTLMAFMIVLIFGLCWGPYNIILFLLIFVWEWRLPSFCSWQSLFFAVKFLCFSNAAVNPCVYFIFLKNFRRGLINQLSKSRQTRRNQYQYQVKNTESLLCSLQTTVRNTNCGSSAKTSL